ncbi:AEC family transporter [Georgenia sp. MJ170]|uniref:AEC family transporter n=1 Tax=Georgenia sunbinii TaxID=3117728 RepID=UPI002F25F671
MIGVLHGFSAVAVVIAVGAVLAHIGFLNYASQAMLAKLAFFVASPALMLTVLSEADVGGVFSGNLIASAGAVAVAIAVYLLLSRWVARRSTAETVIGALCSSYVNAGNLGIPIAAYVLGDAAYVAPIMLLQLVLIQPVALAVLDRTTAAAGTPTGALLRRSASNPLLIGALVGLVLALTGFRLPTMVQAPIDLLAAMAVPTMLLAYGVSLRLGPKLGGGTSVGELALIVGLKMVLQPGVAYVLGRFVLGLDDVSLFAVTVMAALPTAQNVFVFASRYERGVTLARDTIFVSTIASVPVITIITALLH